MKPIASGEIYRSVIQTAAPMYLFKAQETRVITVPSSSSFPAKATAPVNLHAVFSKPAPEKKTATDKPTVPQTIGGNLQTPDHTRTFFGAPAGLVGTVAGNTMANQRLPQTKPEAPGASIQKVQVDSPVQSSVSMPGAHFLSHRYPPGDILGAKRYLPPGTAFPLPPHLAGEGKFIPPVTSFGIYGVDDSTKQEYFSSGEWLVSEGSKWWKKVLRDHGVEGKAAEEIPSPGWVLVKSGKSTFFEA